MTTDEFIKKAEELGYTVEHVNSVLSVYFTDGGFVVCVLNLKTNQQYSLRMNSGNFFYATDYEEEREKFYNLAVEYDKTPVEKREKEKKYRIRWDLSDVSKRRSYLNKDREGNIFFCDNVETTGVKTIFTAQEIELMPFWVSHFIVKKFLVQEEVE